MESKEIDGMAKSMKEYGYSMCSMSISILDLLRVIKKRDHLLFKDILDDALELYMAKYPEPRSTKPESFSERTMRSIKSGGKDKCPTVELDLE